MSAAGEKLLFEISTPGARAVDLPASDVPHAELDPALASFTESGLPELGQLEVVRHYTHLTHRNFSVDANFYPLGSCTMKYNPKVNERAAALPGFANLHPMADEDDAQGALGLLYHLRVILAEIAGLDEVSLQPCAGAHGEWTALKVIRAYFKDHGQPKRRIVLASVLVAASLLVCSPARGDNCSANAAAARWGDRLPRATHAGEIKNERAKEAAGGGS